MPTLRLTLTWPDGATVTATATAAHLNDETAVTYAGARERLPVIFERCAVSTLQAMFARAAEEPGAFLDAWQSEPWPEEDDVPPFTVVKREEDFPLERLAVVDGPDGRELHGWFGGVECLLAAKPSMLRSGFASCIPMDSDLGPDWPMELVVLDNRNGARVSVSNATAEPAVIEALALLVE